MTARIALSCDGTFDAGRMPCRGAISLDLEATADAAGLIGADLVDVDAARELAGRRGWSSTDAGDYCPSHVRLALEAAQVSIAPTPADVREQQARDGGR